MLVFKNVHHKHSGPYNTTCALMSIRLLLLSELLVCSAHLIYLFEHVKFAFVGYSSEN